MTSLVVLPKNMALKGDNALVVLPKYMALKGDNDNFLCHRYLDGGYSYLQFSTTDIGESIVACETVPLANGNVRIKQKYNGKFWRSSPNWIRADSDDTSSNNTEFRPIQIDDTTIALINLGNNQFCKRLSIEGKTSCLHAGSDTITTFAKLKVEEPVLRRQIYDIVYDFDHAEIYEESVTALGRDFLYNFADEYATMSAEFTYEDTKTMTWNTSFSLKSSVTATAQAGIPVIAEAKVVASVEMQSNIEWGKTETKKVQKKTGITVSVPPKSKANINLVAKQAMCDVTFTYKQRDTLYDGSTVVTPCNGIFTGANMYSTTFDVPKFEPL